MSHHNDELVKSSPMAMKSMIDQTSQYFWSGVSVLEELLRKKMNMQELPGLPALKILKSVKQKKNLARMRALYNCCRKTIEK